MTHHRGPSLAILAALLAPTIGLDAGQQKDVTIPFELVNKNVFVRVSITGASRPVWFLLDTGVKPAVVDLATAKSFGLELADQIQIGGGGQNTGAGNLVRDSSFHVLGLDRLSQPLVAALPLDDLGRFSGHELAGIFGYDFISQFVVRIDYTARTIALDDPSNYAYHGDGEILPITFNAAFHPVVRAQVVDGDRAPIDAAFVVDTGSGAALILNTPFVDRERFLKSSRATVPWLAGRALGGNVTGSVGRIGRVKLGRFAIDDPVAVFSRTSGGAFASDETQGNIGAAILEKFTVILDYARKRIILEPNATLPARIPYDRTGLSLVSDGNDYRTFHVEAVAERSPASESGIRAGDELEMVDGHPASERTLSDLRTMLNSVSACRLTVKRGDRHMDVTLRPREIL